MRLLTTYQAIINIDPHSKKTSAGRGNPKDTGQRAAIKAVFYCLPKTKNTGLIRVSMLWRADPGSVRRWPVPVSGFSTLFQSVAHSVERRSGGLSSNTGETAMVDHTQNSSKIQDKKTKIEYFQTGRTRRMTTTGVSIAQALALWNAFVGGAA